MQKASALSCAEPKKPEEAIHDYDVVVIATITETNTNSPVKYGKTVKADVSHIFKGYNDSTITFMEDRFWGESEVGKEFLLFIKGNANSYESPLCSPTTLTASLDKKALIEKLTAAAEAVPETSRTNETGTTPTPSVETVNTVESNNEFSLKWSISILTPVILILILIFFFYRRGKAK